MRAPRLALVALAVALLAQASPARAAACTYAYYDCNPADVSVFYDVAWVPPHNSTIHALYTVPAGRKAHLGGMYIRVRRDSGTASPEFAGLEIYVLKGGTTQVTLLDENINSGTVGAEDQSTMDYDNILMPGDQLVELDDDTSIGGTCRFTASVSITEFDT
ncbi:MAG TPA: hypothetical protein VIU62_16110 [Chloroflexota bacterium]|jgi:hypothetical protein